MFNKVSMKEIQADLHIHSIYSDGTFFPKEILKLVNQKEIKLFSITDHNCISAELDDPRFIPGIEISVKDEIKGHEIENLEVLGYGFDIEKMRKKVELLRKRKIEVIFKCVENFNKFDFNSDLFFQRNFKKITIKDFFEFRCNKKLSEEEVKSFIKNSSPTKIDFSDFLFKSFFDLNGEEKENIPFLFKKEFSETIFKDTKPKKFTFKEAISAIKDCGGVAILAHPAMYQEFSKDGLDAFDFIKILKDYGLDGVEQYNYGGVLRYPQEKVDKINNYFKEISEKLGLLNTWGSDCHGETWWGVQLGSFGSTIEEIEPFLRRLNKSL